MDKRLLALALATVSGSPPGDFRVGLALVTTLLAMAGNFMICTYFPVVFDRILGSAVLVVDMALLPLASGHLWSSVLAIAIWGVAGWGFFSALLFILGFVASEMAARRSAGRDPAVATVHAT
jgi:hypothetical protein